jgi:hypothetical protein
MLNLFNKVVNVYFRGRQFKDSILSLAQALREIYNATRTEGQEL